MQKESDAIMQEMLMAVMNSVVPNAAKPLKTTPHWMQRNQIKMESLSEINFLTFLLC